MTTVYLDLDGTVLDVKIRLYRVYADSVKELGGKNLSFDEYWWRKRAGLTDADIVLGSSGLRDTGMYNQERQRRLESAEYLGLDTLIPGVLGRIADMRRGNTMVLVTMRSNSVNLRNQLQELSIGILLDKVISSGDSGDSGNLSRYSSKYDMLLCDGYLDPEDSVIIGDTAEDIITGKKLCIGTIAVLSGIRGWSVLAECHPDLIVDDITQVKLVNGKAVIQ